jgi:TonB family protein
MKRYFVAVLLVACCFGQTATNSVKDRLLRKSGVASLRPGFRLSYSLTTYGVEDSETSSSGTYIVTGRGDAWRSDIDLPGHSETTWHQGTTRWRKPDSVFTPLRLAAATGAIEALIFDPDLTSPTFHGFPQTTPRRRKIRGKDADCFKSTPTQEEWCFDRDSVLLEYKRGSTSARYESWQPLEELIVPEVVSVYEEDRKIADLKVIKATLESVSESQLQAEKDAIVIFDCKGKLELPNVIFKPEPEFTDEARRRGVQGNVLLGIEITASGEAIPRSVLRSVPELDPAALRAVSRWRFKPAKCDGTPMRFFANVNVDFRRFTSGW